MSEKSEKYELVKYYYDNYFWNLSKVSRAVTKGWITEDEFEEITGMTYT